MTMPTLLRLQMEPSRFRAMSLCATLVLSACSSGGSPGPQGPEGPQGPAGQPGTAGPGLLVRTTAEPEGANCASAGSKFEVGGDANRNGTLDDNEVDATQTRYVCNGAQGVQGEPGPANGPVGPTGPEGKRALVSTSAEGASPGTCPNGGIKLEAGVDADGNGTLDAAEADITLTRYVCNGAQGIQGTPGAKGDTGAKGDKGDKGDTGATGAAGARALVKTSGEAMGANCATGGIKLEAGVDADGNSTLDTAEVDAALTRYVCNGPQGIQGLKGDKGDTGSQGIQGLKGDKGDKGDTGSQGIQGLKGDKGDTGSQGIQGLKGDKGDTGSQGIKGDKGDTGTQGPAGGVGVYGDGSGGAFSLSIGNSLDLTTQAGFNALAGRHHLQFTTINIAGNLVVPSGTVLRATGDVTVTGTITVATGAQDVGGGPPNPGMSQAAAGTNSGGVGLSALSASLIKRPSAAAGGAGDRGATVVSGGEGGGSLVILSRGNVSIPVGGIIAANGNSGTNPSGTADVPGSGGGAGGIIIIGAKGNLTVGGILRANGGAGAPGVNGNTVNTQGAGGGGGGGGGIIHLVASTSPAITGTLLVSAGAAGTDAFMGSGTFSTQGGGGGACGGNGGTGGVGNTAGNVAAQAGVSGYTFTTVVPEPENLFLH